MKLEYCLGTIALGLLLSVSCTSPKNNTDYLKSVLNNLETIESARYYVTNENWVPGDTAAQRIYRELVIEFDNPADTTIGAMYVEFLESDSTLLLRQGYDGNMRAFVNHDSSTIMVDSFKLERFPFRLVSPPFFNYAKNIMKYSLETTDSILLQIDEESEWVHMVLTTFEDAQVEFFGDAYHMPVHPDYYMEPTSRYEIWIDKKTSLPYKIKRDMSHDITIRTIDNLRVNEEELNSFAVTNFFPQNYTLRGRGEGTPNINFSKAGLLGEAAPEWSLLSTSNQVVSLRNIESNVILLMFTSVSCGPCKIAIPHMNELSSRYDKSDLEVVAVECSTQSMNALNRYRENNKIQYTLLQSNDEVYESYGILGFPIFFILDKEHSVQKIINGYNQNTFVDEITTIVNEIL